MGNNQAK